MNFLVKFGGSLITHKQEVRSARLDILQVLAKDVVRARAAQPGLKLLLGHGSGSFGHVSGSRHQTRNGVESAEQWIGFSEVWYDARKLNQIVIEELCRQSLPVIAFPPSAAVVSRDKQVLGWDTYPIEQAMQNGLIPVVNGDVVFDTAINGTILSTEDLFLHLIDQIPFDRILLVGTEPGVWRDFPSKKSLMETITPAVLPSLTNHLGGSNATDVTGGMAAKVQMMIEVIRKHPHIKVSIFSGEAAGNLYYALVGGYPGTTIQFSD